MKKLNVKRVYREFGDNAPFNYKELKSKISGSKCKCEVCGDQFREGQVFGNSKDPIVLGNLEKVICHDCFNALSYFKFNTKNLSLAIKLIRDLNIIS